MKTKTIVALGLFTISLFLFSQCENELDMFSDDRLSGDASGRYGGGNGGGGGGGGEPTADAGSNLSFPVIWSEGVEKALRVPPSGTVDGVKLTGKWWYVWGVDPIDPQATINSCDPALVHCRINNRT